eukprot:GHVP01050142.1.p1 GENE.GHVP01050142.1~~GHVP01050142.1.p1  ORF type:complete len:313 (-),score=50.53 GHVP01050142.1:20-958(-)
MNCFLLLKVFISSANALISVPATKIHSITDNIVFVAEKLNHETANNVCISLGGALMPVNSNTTETLRNILEDMEMNEEIWTGLFYNQGSSEDGIEFSMLYDRELDSLVRKESPSEEMKMFVCHLGDEVEDMDSTIYIPETVTTNIMITTIDDYNTETDLDGTIEERTLYFTETITKYGTITSTETIFEIEQSTPKDEDLLPITVWKETHDSKNRDDGYHNIMKTFVSPELVYRENAFEICRSHGAVIAEVSVNNHKEVMEVIRKRGITAVFTTCSEWSPKPDKLVIFNVSSNTPMVSEISSGTFLHVLCRYY